MQVLAQPGDVVLYTDGGCNNNGNRIGAYAFVCIELDHYSPISTFKHGKLLFGKRGRVENTTNNIMEMKAVLEGLYTCRKNSVVPHIVMTDSEYVQKGLTIWGQNWLRHGWRTASGSLVKNQGVWIELLKIRQPSTHVIHIKGHSGVFWNEFCDKQASELITGGIPELRMDNDSDVLQ